jgi:PAS domain S-box-containing protein
LDLIMPGADGYSVLKHIRSHSALADVPVVVLTALDSDDEIRRIFAEGADDYVHKPFRPTELVARLTGQLRMRDYVERLARREHYAQLAVELTQELASSPEIRTVLTDAVRRLAECLRVDRCSIVILGNSERQAHVVVTNDDTSLRDRPIALADYPELRHVLASAETLVIEDVPTCPLLANHLNVAQIPFRASVLVPICHDRNVQGAIFLRSRSELRPDTEALTLVRTVANATAIAFSSARVLQSLKEATAASTTARVAAEERLRHFQRYVDFFESAADGMMVVDGSGTILFTNPKSHEITGFSASELRGRKLDTLLFPLERDRLDKRGRALRGARSTRDTDMVTQTKQGKLLVLSVSANSVLHEDDATLLNLRDVTSERHTAVALRQTKEFLERVIDSSADAIISTDRAGNVLLFNRAASRMFDYEQEDVVGALNVTALFPSGTPRAILRQLASRRQNEGGRLEDFRLDILSREGQLIPASLSAAFIIEDGCPAGVVGVLTDLRERLRMEQSLQAAEQELREREKQSFVAELAGATAHELNQPLTSVIGYSELLKRNLPIDSPLANAANVIIGEAERMAEIVRRIGRITRYETKAYVGGAKILDLERASPDSSKKANTYEPNQHG